MVIVGDAPFVLDSVIDARAKARHPSNVRGPEAGSMYSRWRPASRAYCEIFTHRRGRRYLSPRAHEWGKTLTYGGEKTPMLAIFFGDEASGKQNRNALLFPERCFRRYSVFLL